MQGRAAPQGGAGRRLTGPFLREQRTAFGSTGTGETERFERRASARSTKRTGVVARSLRTTCRRRTRKGDRARQAGPRVGRRLRPEPDRGPRAGPLHRTVRRKRSGFAGRSSGGRPRGSSGSLGRRRIRDSRRPSSDGQSLRRPPGRASGPVRVYRGSGAASVFVARRTSKRRAREDRTPFRRYRAAGVAARPFRSPAGQRTCKGHRAG